MAVRVEDRRGELFTYYMAEKVRRSRFLNQEPTSRRNGPAPQRLRGRMFYKSLRWSRGEKADRGVSMVAEPKTTQSGRGAEDSTPVLPNFSDLPKPASSTLDDRVGSLDARAQSALLQEAFEAHELPLPGSDEDVPSPARQPTAFKSRWVGRALKSAVGLAII